MHAYERVYGSVVLSERTVYNSPVDSGKTPEQYTEDLSEYIERSSFSVD